MLHAALLLLVLAAPPGEEPTVTAEFSAMPLGRVAQELRSLTGTPVETSQAVRHRRVTLTLKETPLSDALRLLEERSHVEARPLMGKGWRLVSSGEARPISLDLRNAPLEDIFRLFHEIAGLNFAVHPDVAGKTITIDLDNTPWDQGLDLIARTHDLDVVWEGHIILIGPSGIVPSELTLEEGEVGLQLLLYVGKRNGTPGVHADEVLAAEGLTVVDARWAQGVERQGKQFEEAFGLSEVSLASAPQIVILPGEPGTVTTTHEDGSSFAIEATAWPGAGDKPRQVRVRVTLRAWEEEVGTTDVLATVGKPFTLAGRNASTGSYLFLSVTPWVGPTGAGRFGLPRAGDLDAEPRKLSGPSPNYPPELRKAGVQGKVTLDVTVEKDGTVSAAEVLYAPDDGLAEAAVEAVRQWRYEPVLRNDEPTRFKLVVLVQFKLQ
jgi:TonB family protein